jgi:hypothetical protein
MKTIKQHYGDVREYLRINLKDHKYYLIKERNIGLGTDVEILSMDGEDISSFSEQMRLSMEMNLVRF